MAAPPSYVRERAVHLAPAWEKYICRLCGPYRLPRTGEHKRILCVSCGERLEWIRTIQPRERGPEAFLELSMAEALVLARALGIVEELTTSLMWRGRERAPELVAELERLLPALRDAAAAGDKR